jgi:hypothetical protein
MFTYRSQPSTRPHWDEIERDITRGEHFASLDDDARREYLERWRPVARVEDGQVLIDLDAYTDEHGVKIGLRTDGSTKPAFTIRPGLAGDVRISVPASQAG